MAYLHQINVSSGGVPKLPVDRATIDSSGVVGDLQSDQDHHGGPDQALCLYSLEVIEALREEGHPIEPGSAGENLTFSGLPWSSIMQGQRLRIGAAVVIEVTHPTTPCYKNAAWFIDGNFARMSPTLHPGFSRHYARVLQGGVVQTGDGVEVV